MLFYLTAYLFFFTFAGLSLQSKNPKLLLVVASLPFFFLVALRGSSIGSDTPVYIYTIEGIQNQTEGFATIFEPLFTAIIEFLLLGVDDPFFVLLAITGLSILLLYWSWFKLESDPVFFPIVISVYYLQISMNMIRAGLSFAILSVAALFLVKQKKFVYLILVIAAGMIHVSSIFLSLGLYFINQRFRFFSLLAMIIVLIVSFGLLEDRLAAKYVEYTDFHKPSIFSGFSPLALALSILTVWFTDRKLRPSGKVKIIFFYFVAVSLYMLTQFTYAGLRFQVLYVMLVLLSVVVHVKKYNLTISKKSKQRFFLIAFVFGLLTLRNMFSDDVLTAGHFYPYEFFWD